MHWLTRGLGLEGKIAMHWLTRGLGFGGKLPCTGSLEAWVSEANCHALAH